ncbi:MAG: PDZ domain-containing protein [Proteobacteria bacterium]|nr:PDZ domain-containing protein [Pseudomonadota bacterium]
MQKNTLLYVSALLLTGMVLGYFMFAPPAYDDLQSSDQADIQENSIDEGLGSRYPNPFAVGEDNTKNEPLRIQSLEMEVAGIKDQLQDIEQLLQRLSDSVAETGNDPAIKNRSGTNRNRFSSMLNQRLYNVDNLVRGGIDPATAEDIVRRKNAIDLKRLQLQDHAKRENYFDSQRYYDELEQINLQDTTLREELGDDRYDKYLYDSKQNNRIRISSVMLGSAAELAGIKRGDVVLSYDGQRMFSWQELKDATSQGELGEYVSISVYRNGEVFSFSVPRGPLGMQLGATRLAP